VSWLTDWFVDVPDDLTDSAVAYEYADQMIDNMAEGEWSSSWLEAAKAITASVAASSGAYAEDFWRDLATVWHSYDGWAESEGIPYWDDLGGWFDSQVGAIESYDKVKEDLAADVAPENLLAELWEQIGPYVVVGGALWLVVQIRSLTR
jgi:phage-related minor tail protein